MAVRNTDFNEDLTASDTNDGIFARILLRKIPGALNVHKSHTENDKHGTDLWVEMRSGNWISVDCKLRSTDCLSYGIDDLCLETWSVIGRKIGWARDPDKRTDFILWYWKDTGRFLLMPFQMLLRAFNLNWREWRIKYKCEKQSTLWNGQSYESECVFVPREELWKVIHEQFSGKIPKEMSISNTTEMTDG